MKLYTLIAAFVFGTSTFSQDTAKANQFYNAEQYEKALKEYDEIISYNSSKLGDLDTTILPQCRYNKALCHYFLGDSETATDELLTNIYTSQKAYGFFSDLEYYCYEDAIAIFNEIGNNEKILSLRKELVERWKTVDDSNDNINLGYAYNHLGIALYNLTHDQEAISSYNKAIEILEANSNLHELDLPTIYSNRAICYAYTDQFDKAKLDYLKAFESAYNYDTKEYQTNLRIFREVAKEMISINEYSLAAKTAQIDIEAISTFIGDQDSALINSYLYLGNAHFNNGNTEEANEAYKKSLDIAYNFYRNQPNQIAFWDSYYGYIHQNNGNYREGLKLNKKALDYYSNHKSSNETAFFMTNNSALKCAIGIKNYKEAIPLSDYTVKSFSKQLNSESDYNYYLDAVAKNIEIRNLANDFTSIPTIMAKTEKQTPHFAKKTIGYMNFIDQSIEHYTNTSKFEQAHELMDKQLKLFKTEYGENSLEYGVELNLKGMIFQRQGKPLQAIEHFEKANLTLSKHDYINQANCLNNLALSQMDLGDYRNAEKTYLKVNSLHEQNNKNTIHYITSLCNLGRLYLDMKKNKECLEIYEQAHDLSIKIVGKDSQAHLAAKQGLANIYLRTNGKAVEAFDLFSECMQLIEKIYPPNDTYAIEMIGNIGHVLCIAQQYESGIEILKNIKTTQERYLGSKNPKTLLTSINLALAHQSSGNNTQSKDLNLEIVNHLEEIINYNLKYMSEEQSVQYLEMMNTYYSAPYSYLIHNTKDSDFTEQMFNATLQSKGKLLQSNTALKRQFEQSKDPKLIAKYKEWTELVKNIVSIQSNGGEDEELSAAIKKANSAEKELISNSKEFKKVLEKKYDWESIQKKMGENEILLEFTNNLDSHKFLGDTIQYGVFVLTKTNSPKYINLFKQRELIKIIGKYGGNNLNYIQSIYGVDKSDTKLYDLIWSKISPYLETNNKVWISPSGLLHKISFAGISNGANFLNEIFDISNVPSGVSLLNEKNEQLTEFYPTIIGGVNYNAGLENVNEEIWTYLEGTNQESKEINKLLEANNIKSTLLTGDQVTENYLLQSLSNKNIAHIATHGFFYPKPSLANQITELETETVEEVAFRGGSRGMGYSFYVSSENSLMRSGIALSGANKVWNNTELSLANDGVLTAQDIILEDLSNLDLVVLSACETGLGDIEGSEGVYGLQRSLKIAGVNNLIMSLWQVPDKETKEFMIFFYKELVQSKNIEGSFRKAQRTMSSKYAPYYWAAFVLI